jgi:hypothetical protein
MPITGPWEFLRAYGLPNVKWCEAQNASWIIEPANTWSNLGFVLSGVLMLFFLRRDDSVWLKLYAVSEIILGIFSGIYHASYTYLFQIADFLGMIMTLLAPLLFGLERLGVPFPRPVRTFAWATGALTVVTCVLAMTPVPIQIIIALMALSIVGIEFRLWRGGGPGNRPLFFASITFLVVAETFSFLDVSRNFCHPDDHLIQGHAVHHVLVATCFFFNFLYIRQITRATRSVVAHLSL